MVKFLILYAYFENENSKRNLIYFLKYGVFDKEDYKYILISNSNITVEIPKFVTLIQRENKGYDFGAWAIGLKEIINTKENLNSYDYFIFINSTVIGPFLPSYVSVDWPFLFSEMIDDKVKLVGTTINCRFKIHVQSMFFLTDKIGLSVLIDKGIFKDNDNDTKVDVINKREIRMTHEIMNCGYQINCIFSLFRDSDYKSDFLKSLGDVYLKNAIHGPNVVNAHDIDPLDVIFFKSNRGFGEKQIQKYIMIQENKFK